MRETDSAIVGAWQLDGRVEIVMAYILMAYVGMAYNILMAAIVMI